MTRRTFVNVEIEELVPVDAVIAMPVEQARRLVAAGFLTETSHGYGSTSRNHPVDPRGYTDDMLLKTPGAFVVRL